MAVATVSFVSMTAPAAVAGERVCRGAIGAEAVDDVRVPRGATCELTGTLVRGNVRVEANATLLANDVIVIGDVRGDLARAVSVLADSRVGGSVQVKQGGGATIADSDIGNNVRYDRNRGAVSLSRSEVDGNVQADGNTGGVLIEENTIGGNLQCRDNRPPPAGGGNVVGGNKEGQCRNL
jgi:hypothetical protein